MSLDKKSQLQYDQESDGESGRSGTGTSGASGQGGQIEFKDFIGSGENLRDDLLSSEDKQRYLKIHESVHQDKIKNQKALREQRQAIKDGKIPLQTYHQSLSASAQGYKTHFLSMTAQFGAGRDRQVNEIPSEQIAETNNEKREELQLGYKFNNEPKYNNALKYSPPKLTPR